MNLDLLEEVLGAKFKFQKLSQQFGFVLDQNLGFMEKSSDSNPSNLVLPPLLLLDATGTNKTCWGSVGEAFCIIAC